MGILRALAVLVALLLAAPVAADVRACENVPDYTRVKRDLLVSVNRARRAEGLRRLSPDAILDDAARAHNCDMMQYRYFSHTGRDGSSAMDRIRRLGYEACFSAENLALGHTNVPWVMGDWMASPGHRANILSGYARHIGISAIIETRTKRPIYWALVFARPC
ncbi:MAG: CAP domain-containing protein [Rhodobacteraceae bacterium]|nr:CAP domain-containing protein [Paracoccaceae bacterium]